MPKKEESKEEPKKKKGFFSSVFFIILLILITAAVVATNIYDRDNSQNKISIFVFDPGTRTIYEREIAIPRQVNLIEGDFINGIIRNSNYITDDMKFRSAYNLRIDNVNTTVVKLNAAFANLKKNPELFNGFSQAVTNTILKNFPNIQSVIIQIDGETNTQ